MRRNNINAMLIVVVMATACILPACGGSGSVSLASSIGCSTVTYNAPSGTANNIVFTFDKPYVCGQFANGDWWVAPNSAGGTVTINSITPAQAFRAATGKVINGAMVNPSSVTLQGWDGDIPGSSYSSGLSITLPLTINTTTTPISSVVKAASTPGATTGNNPQFQYAAVLTVIASSGDMTGQFRPSYFGASASKFQIAVSSINTTSLGQVDLSSVSAVAGYTFSQLATDTTGLQLDHINNYLNQFYHPYDNSYKYTGYGSEASIYYSKPLIRFSSNDFSYSNATDKQALINYLQHCIDLAGDVQGGTSFNDGGGGYGFGRLLALLFAGQVLGNSTITNLTSSGTFGENLSFYQSTSTGRVLHGEYYSFSAPWTWPDVFFEVQVTGTGSKTVRDPMGWTDSGSGSTYAGAYLACCVAAPARYEAMAASMLGFGSATPFNYMLLISNRVQNHGLQFSPDPFAPYDGTPANQDITWGNNVSTDSGVFIAGSGRNPTVDGKIIPISHTDTMGEAVWTYWVAKHNIVPPVDVTTLADIPGVNQNALAWTASPNAVSYNVYRATDTAEFLNSGFLANTLTNSYTDTGLITGTTYAYWVVAIDAQGNVSNMSNKVTGKSN